MRLRVGVALLLIVAAVAAVQWFRPIPAVAATALLPSSDVVPGTPPALPWPGRGAAAVGVSGLGLIASSGNEQPIPAASVTKVMTALIILFDDPLVVGAAGPGVTVTAADVQAYQNDLVQGQSVVRVEEGEVLSELQILEGMLIPSANNYAELAARWDGGSVDAFVAKMNARAAAMKMTHTHFADPAGALPQSTSTPSDLFILGAAAMKDPVFAFIVAKPQVDLPAAGTVYNVDAALGQNGIVGIKTGSGLNTGANFLFAADVLVDGRHIFIVGCVMGQPSLAIAFSNARSLIATMTPALHVRRVIARNQSVANYTTPWGNSTDLVSQVDVDLAEWPGMVVRQHLDANALVVDHPLPSSTREGTEHVVLGDYDLDVPLVTADPLYPPGRFWRLTRVAF
jgi:serine-type D-Ala-D-Ala carboxypeptidase (penicillin-binding protein 5/6)